MVEEDKEEGKEKKGRKKEKKNGKMERNNLKVLDEWYKEVEKESIYHFIFKICLKNEKNNK